uniref:Uncharacterized protein n=1 Tax=Glossina palpalis gambiensis TaxID=67801 RepID=A0A1B0AXI9_9MUSC
MECTWIRVSDNSSRLTGIMKLTEQLTDVFLVSIGLKLNSKHTTIVGGRLYICLLQYLKD